MKAGEPACSLFVETANPEAPLALVPSRMTTELSDYIEKMQDVIKFTSGTFNLFDRAKDIRPSRLVSEY